ncbi:MAG: nucleoside-diphosphate kinase [Spirochaetales bacterium]|nr:nucleoside-diphosphate kinase [Spirochaetales bacterium]
MHKKELDTTLVLIKPDALKNSLTGYILSQLSEFNTGLRFAGMKVVQVNRILAEEHYAEHRGKVFYPPLIDYIMGLAHYPNTPDRRRVIAIVYQGPNAVPKIRQIVGSTDPHCAREGQPGSIRALGMIVHLRNEKGEVIGQRMDNLIHASANAADAEREIKLWFKPNDIPPRLHPFPTRQSEKHYYYKVKRLFTCYEPESVCIFAPGDEAWESDLDVLEKIDRGKKPAYPLETVVAKYLSNEARGMNL